MVQLGDPGCPQGRREEDAGVSQGSFHNLGTILRKTLQILEYRTLNNAVRMKERKVKRVV